MGRAADWGATWGADWGADGGVDWGADWAAGRWVDLVRHTSWSGMAQQHPICSWGGQATCCDGWQSNYAQWPRIRGETKKNQHGGRRGSGQTSAIAKEVQSSQAGRHNAIYISLQVTCTSSMLLSPPWSSLGGRSRRLPNQRPRSCALRSDSRSLLRCGRAGIQERGSWTLCRQLVCQNPCGHRTNPVLLRPVVSNNDLQPDAGH